MKIHLNQGVSPLGLKYDQSSCLMQTILCSFWTYGEFRNQILASTARLKMEFDFSDFDSH